MSKVKIYVEGVNDRIFIANFLEKVLGINVSINKSAGNEVFVFAKNELKGAIIVLKGWTNLKNNLIQEDIKSDKEEGIQTIVLLDADTLENDGSFVVRQRQVEELKTTNNLEFDYFLMPNNSADGYLETILRNIIKEPKQLVLDCIDANDDCLRQAEQKIDKVLNIFPLKGAEKSKLNYFRRLLYNLEGEGFKDESIWDLDAPYLLPLKTFLSEKLGLNSKKE